jgi:hypothetical protein
MRRKQKGLALITANLANDPSITSSGMKERAGQQTRPVYLSQAHISGDIFPGLRRIGTVKSRKLKIGERND